MKRKLELPIRPAQVPCPHCGAPPDKDCEEVAGWKIRSAHERRKRLAEMVTAYHMDHGAAQQNTEEAGK